MACYMIYNMVSERKGHVKHILPLARSVSQGEQTDLILVTNIHFKIVVSMKISLKAHSLIFVM